MYNYFDIQAKIGITKHMGGLDATKKLLEMCEVNKSDYLLVVGSGNGVSAIKIHKMTGCEVVGIDISEEMILRAWEKLNNQYVGIEFIWGDVENIDFPDNTFDVVISESVTGFTNKKKSLYEYHRVLKKNGYIGLNEVTWLNDPSKELEEYSRTVMGLVAETKEGWLALLKNAGFNDIQSSVNDMSQWKQLYDDLELQSMDFFRIWSRFSYLYLFEREYRKSVHRLAWKALHIPRTFNQYFAYGLYVGQK
jgi:arsenite methyltransferase